MIYRTVLLTVLAIYSNAAFATTNTWSGTLGSIGDPTDWPIYCGGISFDFAAGDVADDAYTIRENPKGVGPLGMAGNGMNAGWSGEWYTGLKWATSPSTGKLLGPVERNEAFLWHTFTTPRFKAWFCYDPATSMDLLSAQIVCQVSMAGVGTMQFIPQFTIRFNPATGYSNYVRFDAGSMLPADVRHEELTFNWYVSEVRTSTQILFLAPAETLASTGPHRMYLCHKDASGTDPVGDHSPWKRRDDLQRVLSTDALYFAIVTAGVAGETTKHGILSRLVEHLFDTHPVVYDAAQGAPGYTPKSAVYVWTLRRLIDSGELARDSANRISWTKGLPFFLFDYIGHSAGTQVKVNCYDQAAALHALASVCGVKCCYAYQAPFGYIQSCRLVGVPEPAVNNPFFENPANSSNAVEGADYTKSTPAPHRRSGFGNHAFVTLDVVTGNVYDCCSAPVGSGYYAGSPLGSYLTWAIDRSTTPEAEFGCSTSSVPVRNDVRLQWD